MGILNNIRNKIPTLRNTNHTKYNETILNTLHPITTLENHQLYLEAMNNPEVYRCLTVYKNTALSCNFNIDTDTIDTDNTVTKEYLTRLFHQPEGIGSQVTWADTNSLIYDSFLGMGDCFFEISTDNQYNMFNGFKYIHNQNIMWNNEQDCYQLTYQPDVLYEPDELIHIRMPNPRREKRMWGVSMISKVADFVALYMNAIRYNNNILNNDGLDPHTIISYPESMSPQAFAAEMDRFRVLKERQKMEGSGTIAVKGATVQKASTSNRDMNYLELLRFARDGIIRGMGVPPQLAGIIESGNLGSGSGDSQKKDWKITFDGISTYVENAFNNTLKRYGFDERFHYQNIDVIDEMYDAQVAEIYLRNGVLTRDEVRNELGLDKLTGNWEAYWR